MNKTPKPNPAPAPGAADAAFQPLSGGKKSPRLPAHAAKPAKPGLSAKGSIEAAERDKKLDLILHRFAKLL